MMASPEGWLSQAIDAAGVAGYPLDAPEGLSPPYVIYGRSQTVRAPALDGTPGRPVGTFLIDIYSDGYLAGKTLADTVRAAVNNFSGSAAGATTQHTDMVDEADGDLVYLEGRDRPTYLIQQTLQITWEE
jgi:hypothetical protein